MDVNPNDQIFQTTIVAKEIVFYEQKKIFKM